jgi:ABC-type Fe3+-hydroxamate transport system substrate-binding protein
MPESDARTDWAGTVHEVAPAARIACLVPSITELLFALGLGEGVVARTGFCIHPHDAIRAVPKIGGTKDPDLGRLRELAPTHLIVNVDENRREIVDAARAFVPHVIVTHPLTLDENPRLYRLFGSVFARYETATALCDAFDRARADLAQSVESMPRERVLYLIWTKPWMTVAADTYIADVLAAAGWDIVRTTDEAARYPALDDEDPGWERAERILLATEPFAFVERHRVTLAAAKRRPVHLIDAEMTSWYGPRAINGMRYLGNLRRSLAATDGA